MKVAIWKRHDWHDEEPNRQIVQNFGHAAELAKYADLKGLALDLEPYVPIWAGEAGGLELSGSVYRTATAIGKAMHNADPEMTLILLQDALYWSAQSKGYHGDYGLSRAFLSGLLSTGFKRVIVALEGPSYAVESSVAAFIDETRSEWATFMANKDLSVTDFLVAPGLWPLGHSYTDKSARMTVKQFSRALEKVDDSAEDYVWIYGFGSAWQSNGPYGDGKVVKRFPAYINVIHERNKRCESQSAKYGK
jgi:hypothetical protein